MSRVGSTTKIVLDPVESDSALEAACRAGESCPCARKDPTYGAIAVVSGS